MSRITAEQLLAARVIEKPRRRRRVKAVTPAERHAERQRKARERRRRYWRKHKDDLNKKRRAARRLIISSYPALAKAARERREALGLSQLGLDAAAGMADGHTGKLEIGAARGKGWGRYPGVVGTQVWFDALDMTLQVVDCEGVAISEEKKRGEYTGKLVMRLVGVKLAVVK